MAKKRTYSQRDSKTKAFMQEARRKRSKDDNDSELRWPRSPTIEHPHRSSSLLKKGLKKYRGPVSIPQNDMDFEPPPKPKNPIAVLDRALEGKPKPANYKQHTLYGSRSSFNDAMTNRSQLQKSCDTTGNSYLPTPPAEIPKRQAQKHSHLSGDMNRSNEDIPHKYESKQPYVPKRYKADEASSPRRDILGGRISKSSKEARIWTLNQTHSPFLRLPGELRNQIYENLLGGQTIFIRYTTYRPVYEANKPKKMVPVFKYHCTTLSRRGNPFRQYQPPGVGVSDGYTLLNSVCRQLYLETASIPFERNVIAFSSHNVMVNFLMEHRLSHKQRHGITILMLPDDVPGNNVLKFLPNLKKVYLVFDKGYNGKGWYYVRGREEGMPMLEPPMIYDE